MKTNRLATTVARRRGFTLLEVLLVLVILGVIAALVVPRLIGSQERALKMATETGIKETEAKVELYAIEHDATYPQSLDNLLHPVDRDGKPMRPYVKEIPRDAWQQPLNYELAVNENAAGSSEPRIWSNGPNHQNENGSGDDIHNWSDTSSRK